MNPFLLPLVLILYGEYSDSPTTRYLSRCFLYLYMFTNLLPIYFPSQRYALLVSLGIVVTVIMYLIKVVDSAAVTPILVTFLIVDVINRVSLLFEDYSFVQAIPYYMDYSGHIYRSLIVASVATLSYMETKDGHDYKLEFMSILFCVLEVI